jgi:Rrf2 family transcriptional regulator, nitric oxide-sensitive transcriptional repressor
LPEDINVGEVVGRMEPDMEVVACFGDPGICIIQPSCVLKGALAEALDAFTAVLDRYTLADLIAPRAKLTGLLNNTWPRHR